LREQNLRERILLCASSGADSALRQPRGREADAFRDLREQNLRERILLCAS